MNNDGWKDRIGRDLERDHIDPASEEFYRGVWRRITAARGAPETHRTDSPIVMIGLACWHAVPVFAVLLLAIALYGWFFPPDFPGHSSDTIDAYALDVNGAPSQDDVFYQVMCSPGGGEPEEKQ